jgi:hypothetical protein
LVLAKFKVEASRGRRRRRRRRLRMKVLFLAKFNIQLSNLGGIEAVEVRKYEVF